MSQKVICCRADKCKEEDCEHKIPHEVEHWLEGREGKTPMNCEMVDTCGNHKIYCEPICSFIDFEIEELFDL